MAGPQPPPGPQRIGPYEVVRLLGRGGMGVVYEVRHPASPRRLALKLIAGRAAGPEALLRFEREALLLARISHPNVLRVLDRGATPAGDPFLVTELVEGRELRELARASLPGPLEAARLVRALADGVAALHAQGILHRDLKPHNVIVRPDGAPVLIDFGLARDLAGDGLTATGTMLGTPGYMSPEQAEGSRTIDARTDVYGLGAVLYHLLTGGPPFEGATVPIVLKKVYLEEPSWPSAERPGDLELGAVEAVCRVALAKDPAQRPQDAAALRDALDRVLSGSHPPSLPGQARRGAQRGALVGLALALAAGGALSVWQWTGRGALPGAAGVGAEGPVGPSAGTATAPGGEAAPPAPDDAARAAVAQVYEALPWVTDPDFPARAAPLRDDPYVGERVGRLLAVHEALGEGARAEARRAAEGFGFDRLGPAALALGPPGATLHDPAAAAEEPLLLIDSVCRLGVAARFLDDAGRRLVSADGESVAVWAREGGSLREVHRHDLPEGWHRTRFLAVNRGDERVLLGGQTVIDPDDQPGTHRWVPAWCAVEGGAPGTMTALDGRHVEPPLPGDPFAALGAMALAPDGGRAAFGDARGRLTIVQPFAPRPGTATRPSRGRLLEGSRVRGLAFTDRHELLLLADEAERGATLRRATINRVLVPVLGGAVPVAADGDDAPWLLALLPGRPEVALESRSGRRLQLRESTGGALRSELRGAGGRTYHCAGLDNAPLGDHVLLTASGWELGHDELDGYPPVPPGGSLVAWDVAGGVQLARVELDEPLDGAQSVDVVQTPDEVLVLVATQRGRLLLWALPRGS